MSVGITPIKFDEFKIQHAALRIALKSNPSSKEEEMVIFDPLRKFWQQGSAVNSAINTTRYLESVKNKLNLAFVSKALINLD